MLKNLENLQAHPLLTDASDWQQAGDAHLIAHLLGETVPRRAQLLLHDAGSLRALQPQILRNDSGLNSRQRDVLLAAFELGRRALVEKSPGISLRDPQKVVARFRDLGLLEVETLIALGVDASRRAVVEHRMIGSVDGVAAKPRDLLRPVLAAGAVGLIAVHNHPSGDSSPSRSDIAFTQRLQQAASLCGIALLDHIIIASGGWCSMRASGWLANPSKAREEND